MTTRTTVTRLVMSGVLAICVLAVAVEAGEAEPDRRPPSRAAEIREMVLKHRERVLARIEAILLANEAASEQGQGEPVATEDPVPSETESGGAARGEEGGGEAEGEGGSEEGEGAEGEEPEGGEGEDEEVLELPDTGVGGSGQHAGALPAVLAIVAGVAAFGLSLRTSRIEAVGWWHRHD